MPFFRKLLLRTMVGSLLATSLPGQGAAPNPIQRASQLIGTGKATEAIPILDSVTKASPALPQGWALLGAALLATRQLDRSILSLQKALTFPGVRPAVLYNLGLTYGLQGQMDSAFTYLGRAKSTGLLDMTQLGFDADAAPIRAHPRYAELVPSIAEFSSPFVESVRILREWRGDKGGEQFGWIARDVGDVDGDKIHDVVTTTPTVNGNAGAVYLLNTGKGTRAWTVNGAAKDQLGTTAEAAGDINGDGVPDVIAGAPGGEYALVLSGRDGSVIRRLKGQQPGEKFGDRVTDLGDVDGDGRPDLLVAAPKNSTGGADAGRVYLFSGRTGAVLHIFNGHAAGEQFGSALGGAVKGKSTLIVVGAGFAKGGGKTYVYRDLSQTPAFTIAPDSTAAQLGAMFVSVVGDLDADGVLDVYASDWPNSAKGSTTGRVYLYSGATGKELYALTGEGAGSGFGIGAADAGDVDHDGADDLIIGAWQFSGAAPSGGKVFLYSGRTGLPLGQITGKVMGETFGFDATGLGDVDGDGVADMLLTSAWSAVNGSRSGRVYVISGADILKTRTPRLTRTTMSLPTGVTPAMVDQGESLFHSGSCVKCHGENAAGGPRAPSLVAGAWLQHKGSMPEILSTILQGVPVAAVRDSSHKLAMNPRGGPMNLTDLEARSVAAYVWSISRGKP